MPFGISLGDESNTTQTIDLLPPRFFTLRGSGRTKLRLKPTKTPAERGGRPPRQFDVDVQVPPQVGGLRRRAAQTIGGVSRQIGADLGALRDPRNPFQTKVIGPLNRQISRVTQDVSGDINTLRSNQNPFIQQAVRPLQRQINAARGDLQRDFARRGVSGSLAQTVFQDFDQQANRQVEDARVRALDQSLSAIFERQGFIGQAALQRAGQVRSTLETLNNQILQRQQTRLQAGQGQLQISNAELGQALAEIGLSQDAITIMLNAQNPIGGSTQTSESFSVGRFLGQIGSTVALPGLGGP